MHQISLACITALLLTSLPIQSDGAPVKPCNPSEGLLFQLSLRSQRNSTGHRIVKAQLKSEGSVDQDVAVDISQKSARIGSHELITLDTVAAVLPEPSEQAEKLDAPPVTSAAERAPDEDFEEVRYADYEQFPGVGLYKLHEKAVTWEEARRRCQEEHAHLMVVDTKAEADVVSTILNRKLNIQGAERNNIIFSGFSDTELENHYVTVTGKNVSSLEYQKWHRQEPSKGETQNGGGIDIFGDLHDIPNKWKLAFVCEANKVSN